MTSKHQADFDAAIKSVVGGAKTIRESYPGTGLSSAERVNSMAIAYQVWHDTMPPRAPESPLSPAGPKINLEPDALGREG